MRRFMRFIARPGVFTVLIGLLVLTFGIFSWRGMGASPASTETLSDTKPNTVTVVRHRLLVQEENASVSPTHGEFSSVLLGAAVRQVDFAITQAMLRSKIPLSAAVAESSARQLGSGAAYTFQRLRLSIGPESHVFITMLQQALKTWAENASLTHSAAGDSSAASLWTISVHSVVTHELVLPDSFVPSAQTDEGEGKEAHRRQSTDKAARMAIVIDDLGEDLVAVRDLAALPYLVSFAILPRSTFARKTAESGHAAGREILIHQPTEPMKYSEHNPGPNPLLVSLSDGEIEARVRDSLSRVPHAVGMNNHMGSRFTRDRRAVSAMVRPLKNYGFFVLDSLTHPASVLQSEAQRQGIPALRRDVFLDAKPGKDYALRQLRRAEKIALATGSAVAIGHPYPSTVSALKEWNTQRNTQITLVRLSELLFPN